MCRPSFTLLHIYISFICNYKVGFILIVVYFNSINIGSRAAFLNYNKLRKTN
ncbi:hypothetical protein TuanDB_46740 [Bacillus anthracis]|uniref:Uncharacterized protein n=1 Tax=Bacillus anthracis TaxID=1392 RepID=A0A640KZW5_BACAN|nr:hypothetical protein TuanDB_46740 [Bacillus anthracis]